MFNIDNLVIKQALIGSFTWFFTYFFIRRLFNPDFHSSLQFEFRDGLYGAIAMFIMIVLNFVLFKFYNVDTELSQKVRKTIPN